VLVLVGDKEAAIAELDRLLKMPALISKNAIKLNPFFASLRTSPSYARLGI
jgi:hypothetical protein